MSELYMMVTITNRNLTKKFATFYEKQSLDISYLTVGMGTATSEILDYLGLDGAEKTIFMHIVTTETWKSVKYQLRRSMRIDVPGVGIAFIVPLSSIGGKKALSYLTDGQNFIKGEETTLKDTKYELLVTVANQGYSEKVMEAARKVHASGGTMIHAKGSGSHKSEKFMGVTLVPEKDMLFMVVHTQFKNDIMRSIMEDAGPGTKAGAIVFSLPVTDTAGMRLLEEIEEDEIIHEDGQD